MRLVKGTTEYKQYDDVLVYVNEQLVEAAWIYADEELGEVECIFKDQTCECLPVIVDGRTITYKIHGKVRIDAWKLQCGICSPGKI